MWFNTEGDVRHTLMSFGFCHDDGWFDILWRLCQDLALLAAKLEETTGHEFEVLQVKQKMGGLRIRVNHEDDAIQRRLESAKQESFCACEVCGMPGKLREGMPAGPLIVGSKLSAMNMQENSNQAEKRRMESEIAMMRWQG